MAATEIQRELLAKLTAQIAVYTGKRGGGLAVLQDLMHKYDADLPIICECCQRQISPQGGHNEDCEIVKHYTEVFGKEPT